MVMRRWGHSPRSSLRRIQELVAADRYDITDAARHSAESLAFDEDDIVECVLALVERDHFSHSLQAKARPGAFQDVYRVRVHGFPLYVKPQIDASERAVVISFKRDDST